MTGINWELSLRRDLLGLGSMELSLGVLEANNMVGGEQQYAGIKEVYFVMDIDSMVSL